MYTLGIIRNISFLYPFLVAFSFLALSWRLLFIQILRKASPIFFFFAICAISHLAFFYHLSSRNMLLCIVYSEVFGFDSEFSIGIYNVYVGRVAQSVYRLTTRRTVRGSNPGGGEIFRPSRPALRPTQPPVQWVPGLYRGVKFGRGVLLTTHTLKVPRSWNSRAIPLPTPWATTGPVTGTRYLFTYITLILPRSRTGTVWFYTSTRNKRAARPKLYT